MQRNPQLRRYQLQYYLERLRRDELLLLLTLLFGFTHVHGWSCKIGMIDFVDYLDGNSYINKNFQPCIDNQYGEIPVSQEGQSYYSNFSHITAGSPIDPHLESLIMAKAIKEQGVSDPSEADVVLVNDFCYLYQFKPWYGANDGHRNMTSHAIDNMRASERWQLKNGTDFIFVRAYPPENAVWHTQYVCDNLAESFFVVYEYEHYLGHCNIPRRPMSYKTIVMPFQVTEVSTLRPEPKQRNILLAFVGSCSNPGDVDGGRFGNLVRRNLHDGLKNAGEDVQVLCPCSKKSGHKSCIEELTHQETLDLYRRSRFCFLIPGDTQCSKRISEVIFAGCVPVFVGKPFHTLPYRNILDYRKLALFFHLPFANEGAPLESLLVPQDQIIEVEQPMEIVDYLREIRPTQYLQRYQYLLDHISMFEYVPNLSGYPSAVDTIFEKICDMYYLENNASQLVYKKLQAKYGSRQPMKQPLRFLYMDQNMQYSYEMLVTFVVVMMLITAMVLVYVLKQLYKRRAANKHVN
eukprot:TRINITY_DN2548_c0_g2_i1.p1 TRINITY_DN2548_c0_g2~~TRINITY_DN2548_c0_g2_i1.p1  ORF type:complete len:519 (+),score=20.09 TRINITY_DN2548_c0_g2_i1:163-1719(+)